MAEFRIDSFVSRPPEIVYQAFTDRDNMLKWTKYLERTEIVRGAFGEKGSMMKLYYRQKGKIHIMEDKLLYLEPERKIVSEVSGEGLTAQVTIELLPEGSGTRMKMHWKGKGKNGFISLMLFLLRGRIKKQALSEWNTFRRLTEQYGARFQEENIAAESSEQKE